MKHQISLLETSIFPQYALLAAATILNLKSSTNFVTFVFSEPLEIYEKNHFDY